MISSQLKKLRQRAASCLMMSYIFSVLLTACLSGSSDVADKLICFDVITKTANHPINSDATRVCHGANQDYDGDGVENQYDGAPGDYRYFTSVSSDSYYEISNIQQLKAIIDFQCPSSAGEISQIQCESNDHPLGTIAKRLAAHYRLIADIDASSISSWEPIGSGSDTQSSFSGEFAGNRKTISNLNIEGNASLNGLFGYLNGSVSNLILSNSRVVVKISADIGESQNGIATLAAVVQSEGRVNNVYAINPDINVEISNNSEYLAVGGLVGLNQGEIIHSSATGINITETTGKLNIGGLVGWNKGAISLLDSCYSTGIINITGEGNTGGLVGENTRSASIDSSYAAAKVTGKESYIGGLVGNNFSASIENSYATGNVIGGTKDTGGLVGHNSDSASINNSYAIGSVTGGTGNTGGLVGHNSESASIDSSYATGSVIGTSNVGGFVGSASDITSITYSYYSGTVGIVNGSATDVGTQITLTELKELTLGASDPSTNPKGAGDSWTSDNWVGMDSSKFLPTLRSYKVDMEGSQIQGDILCAQPESRVKADDCGDSDIDGVIDRVDNCPTVANALQLNTDDDTEGDVCDDDDDDDGKPDGDDACPQGLTGPHKRRTISADVISIDVNGDGCRDFEEGDYDNDGVADPFDQCRESLTLDWISIRTTDSDADGCEDDIEDIDDDNNGLIEISNDLELNNIRYNLEGNSYDDEEDDTGSGADAGTSSGCHIDGCNGYELINDIYITNWSPVGDDSQGFAAMFNGNNHLITITTINTMDTARSSFGFFGKTSSATIKNLNISVINDIIPNAANINQYIGALVGSNNNSEIENSSAAANITGGAGGGNRVGVLVGYNTGSSISDSTATGNVEGGAVGGNEVGVLVGYNTGSLISASTATGDAEGGAGEDNKVGVLVGYNFNSSISASTATGDAEGGAGEDNNVGGLVGYNIDGSQIEDSHAGGDVTGGTAGDTGGLVGSNSSASISNSYATGDVTGGTGNTGGLVGSNSVSSSNTSSASISNSYATGDVTGGTGDTGGLVGKNNSVSASNASSASISNSHATGDVTGGTGDTGGLVGNNSVIGVSSATIDNSYAIGSVTGIKGDNNDTGGLVGSNNNSTIDNSYATGDVIGSEGDAATGGLVGYFRNNSTINNSYAIGNVTLTNDGGVNNKTGGLVGLEINSTITDSYYSGTVDEGDGTKIAADKDGTQITLTGLKELTLGILNASTNPKGAGGGWTSDNWAGMDSSRFLPTLRSYKEDDIGSQIQGDILCEQSSEHKPCPAAN